MAIVAFNVAILFFCLMPCPSHAQNVALTTIHVQYVDENGKQHTGDIVCNKSIAADLTEIFKELYEARYPIHHIAPAAAYENDDERSMQSNNTSCYNPRRTRNGGLSKHAKGMAIDINPLWNPCIHISDKNAGLIEPSTASRKATKYRITRSDLCYRLFRKHGFKWGGAWTSLKDYQHFEK